MSVQPKGKVETIIIKAWSYAVDYLETKPIHETQRIWEVSPEGETPAWVKYRMELMVNEELIQQLHVYADQCEVLQPESLKKKIADRAKAILEANGRTDDIEKTEK